jgi:hypothetical protein
MLRAVAVVAVLVPLWLAVLPPAASAQASGNHTVTWNTYLGGAQRDEPAGVLTNRDGGVFVTGKTTSVLFPGSIDPPVSSVGEEIFVTRLAPEGNILWSRVLGGTGHDVGRRLAFNNSTEQRLFVVGTTESPALRDGGFPVIGKHGGGKDAFLARMELDGGVSWFMYLRPTTNNEEATDIAIDHDKQVAYVTGESNEEVFVSQVDISDAGPSINWHQTFGSTGPDRGTAVEVNLQEGYVFVGGRVSAPVLTSPVPQPPIGGFNGAIDGFIARLDPVDGAVEWFMYLGGSGSDEVRDLLYSQSPGWITILGNTNSLNYPVPHSESSESIFLLQIRGTSPTIVNKMVVGKGSEVMTGHASIDKTGNIFFGGSTNTMGLALRAFDPNFAPGSSETDGFIAMVDPNLKRVGWISYVGGPTDSPESVQGVSAVPYEQITFIGNSNAERDLLVVNTGADLVANGGQDGFIFRMPVDLHDPTVGTVSGLLGADNRVTARWSGFSDAETGVSYFVTLLQGTTDVAVSEELVTEEFYRFNTPVDPTRSYMVQVTATDLLGHSVSKKAPVVMEPPDAGTPGTDAGTGGQDAGTGGGKDDDGKDEEEGPTPPLGWSCGSAGGGTLAALIAVLALALLSRRRERPGHRPS